MNNQQQAKKDDTPSITITTDIDEKLNSNDIRNDIKKCKRMIRRAEYKIKIYQRKLDFMNKQTNKETSLLEKGLRLLNLNNPLARKI